MALDNRTDVEQRRSRTQVLHRFPETFLRNTDELLLFFVDRADRKRPCAVAVKSVLVRTKIHADDVALSQESVRGRDPVHHFFVDRCADTRRISAIPETGRFRAARTNVFARQIVQFLRRYPARIFVPI